MKVEKIIIPNSMGFTNLQLSMLEEINMVEASTWQRSSWFSIPVQLLHVMSWWIYQCFQIQAELFHRPGPGTTEILLQRIIIPSSFLSPSASFCWPKSFHFKRHIKTKIYRLRWVFFSLKGQFSKRWHSMFLFVPIWGRNLASFPMKKSTFYSQFMGKISHFEK